MKMPNNLIRFKKWTYIWCFKYNTIQKQMLFRERFSFWEIYTLDNLSIMAQMLMQMFLGGCRQVCLNDLPNFLLTHRIVTDPCLSVCVARRSL